jgi:hypothetical protein
MPAFFTSARSSGSFNAYVVESECVLRYDNEAGKGDHIHWADEDRPYKFTTPEQLLTDFWSDVDQRRSK